MAIDDIARMSSNIIGAATGLPRTLDDASILFATLYANAIKNGEPGVTCPECLHAVLHDSAIADVPTGKKDIYGHDDYASGFHCRICEYTTTEWPPSKV